MMLLMPDSFLYHLLVISLCWVDKINRLVTVIWETEYLNPKDQNKSLSHLSWVVPFCGMSLIYCV